MRILVSIMTRTVLSKPCIVYKSVSMEVGDVFVSSDPIGSFSGDVSLRMRPILGRSQDGTCFPNSGRNHER